MFPWGYFSLHNQNFIHMIAYPIFHLRKTFVFLLLALSTMVFAEKDQRPNIVIILTDDQGYGDLGCFGSETVKTPRIDKMAKEGAILSSFYVPAPVCTPSRAGLMTGCYAQRVNMNGILISGSRRGLHPDEVTIAEVAKSAGYHTAMFGKWHLGDQPQFLPTRQGFDEFFGLPYSHDIHPFNPWLKKYPNKQFAPLPLLEGEKVIETDPDADYLTKRITEKAVDFIKRKKDSPFLLYVAHPIPHRPLHMSPAFMKKVPKELREKIKKYEDSPEKIDYETRDEIYPYAMSEIDWSVGKILKELKKQGVAENTLVLYTSDNGPDGPVNSSAGPLRGRKGSTFEGGMREPTVVRWPAKIKAGQDIKELMSTIDLLPTIAHLLDYQMPDNRIIDGKNILPTLTENAPTPHDYFFYSKRGIIEAVRDTEWKLHVNIKEGKPTALYNLKKDIGETKDVMSQHPNITAKLLEVCKNFTADLKANSRESGLLTVEEAKALVK